MVLMGQGSLARHAAVRYTSYSIDSILLTAALMLWTMLPTAYFANGWLLLKLILLPMYIALGIMALRPSHSRPQQAMAFGAALLVYALIISIARNHHPLGVFSQWRG
jgi:uncharacterized membrane protein SirB2